MKNKFPKILLLSLAFFFIFILLVTFYYKGLSSIFPKINLKLNQQSKIDSKIVFCDNKQELGVNLSLIKRKLGSYYEPEFNEWIEVGKDFLFIARDTKNFKGGFCCEGGDNRISNHIIGEYNLETAEIKQLYSLISGPLEIKFYNSQKGILVYSNSNSGEGPRSFLVDLNTKKERELQCGLYEFGQVFGESCPKSGYQAIKIYSVYEPDKEIGKANMGRVDTDISTKPAYWSPDYQYFAFVMFGNEFGIFQKDGKLISRKSLATTKEPEPTIMSIVFSKDSKYYLINEDIVEMYDPSNHYSAYEIFETLTGKVYGNRKLTQDIICGFTVENK